MAKAHELDYNLPQLTVGEIAHVFGVSEQTVRFYHKKGLLVPDTRGDNAYRKYSWNKLSVLAQICFLRRAGFSIEDIKSYMQLDNLQDTHNYMEKFIEKLRQDAADIQRAIGILERKCSYLDTLQSQSVSEAARLATLPLRRYIYLGENDLTAANNEYFFDYPLITTYARSEDGLIHKSGLGAYLDTNAPPDDAEDVCQAHGFGRDHVHAQTLCVFNAAALQLGTGDGLGEAVVVLDFFGAVEGTGAFGQHGGVHPGTHGIQCRRHPRRAGTDDHNVGHTFILVLAF